MTEVSTKPCQMCAEPIQLDAKICKHCDAFQDWRAWISTSQATLALIIALISVIGSAGPGLFKAIRGENSQLTGVFQSFVNRKAIFIVTNTGTRPGSVADAHVFITSDNETVGGASLEIPLLAEKASDHLIPASNSTALILGSAEESTQEVIRGFTNPDLPPRLCSLNIKLIEFSGEIKRQSSILSCRKLFYGLWGEKAKILEKYLEPPV